ncbi:hypothetical protein MTR67_035636 [Solanum verrucosum]|uniref:J domain-containing protein n=1 Tax=Solanum verrucosum TaxID=315347 RepID=A0AAF0UAZ9_SOLVR|nr:hypothetical protein MTR67_035636 [Solanum verrucosum]
MKCNKDEDVTAREIVEQKLTEKDIARAQKFALKAHNLFPDFDGICKFIKSINVYCSHQKKKKTTGEVDIHGILFVESSADDETIKKHYRRLAQTLHYDNNLYVRGKGCLRLYLEQGGGIRVTMLREMKEMVRSIPFLDNPWLGFLHHPGRTHTMVTLSGYQFGMGSLPQFQTQVGGHMHQNPPFYVGRIWRASWARNFSSIPDAYWCTNLDTFGWFHSHTPTGGFGRGANQPNFQGHFLHPMSRLSKIQFQGSIQI